MTQDSNQTAPIAAPHVSRSYPIWLPRPVQRYQFRFSR
jgi:hypothetical protein